MENILKELCEAGRKPLASFSSVEAFIEKVYDLDRTILITGETGVGKEKVVQQIHERAGGNPENFLPVNCASFTEELLVSELFGHTKGAFTGAIEDRRGLFAEEGTLFLDEISETSLRIQTMLLRVLQRTQRDMKPLGSNVPIKAKARPILATNKDLKQLVQQGKFREDLYHRISVFSIRILPLRERIDDIPIIVGQSLKEFQDSYNEIIQNPKQKITTTYFDEEVLQLFLDYPWPGNVRELRNEVERLVIFARGTGEITAALVSDKIKHPESRLLVPSETSETDSFEAQLADLVNQLPKESLQLAANQKLLQKLLYKRAYLLSNGKQSRAAELLGMSVNTLRADEMWKLVKREMNS